jgi:4-amino-4-deoxy-L-arabinose transferase-like glycosyltransferase
MTAGVMNYKKALTCVIVFSIFVRIAFMLLSGANIRPQTFEYEQMAVNLLEGRGFYYDHFQTRYYGGEAPGYSILCYLTYRIFGHHQVLVLLAQILAASFLALPVFLIARRIFNERIAILAAFLAAFHPPMIIYSATKLHTMPVYSLLFALLIWSLLLLKDSSSLKHVFFAGIVAGLTVLFRVTTVLLLFLGLIWCYAFSVQESKRKLRSTAVILAILFLMLLPWGIRNYKVFGRPLLLQTNKWESLYYGNAPASDGSLYGAWGVPIEKMPDQFPPEIFKMNEIGQGEYLKKMTLDLFRSNPKAFIGRVFRKMFYFWYFSPYQGSLYPASWMRWYKAYYLLIFFPAVYSIVYNLFFRRGGGRADILLVVLFLLAIMCAHSLYFVESRHRWSVEPLLLIFTANGFFMLKDILFKRSGAS